MDGLADLAKLAPRMGQTIDWINADRVPNDVVATKGAAFGSGTIDADGTHAAPMLTGRR